MSKDQVKAICARIFQDLLDYNLIFEIEEDDGDEEDEEDGLCKICERETVLTKHHVRPKEVHAKLIKREGFTKEFLLSKYISCLQSAAFQLVGTSCIFVLNLV